MQKQELKELVEKTIDNANELYVKNSFPSIFSKEDVSRLLENLTQELDAKIDAMYKVAMVEEAESEGYDQKFLEKIMKAVVECVEDHDFNDATELELNGKEIYATVETDYLIRQIVESVDEVVEEYKDNLVG